MINGVIRREAIILLKIFFGSVVCMFLLLRELNREPYTCSYGSVADRLDPSLSILEDEADNPMSPGYGGKGVKLNISEMNSADQMELKAGYTKHNFNQMASDLIPLTRRILNVTETECLKVKYDEKKLPKTGVVIIFHNEAWSVLLRSVHSVLRTVPTDVLSEIVLVNDASTHDILHRPLKDYIRKYEKISVVTLTKRSGIMKARMEGVKHVTGEVVVFLDSHVEMPERWLEPLLARIRKHPNILAVPIIDTIDIHDFSYQAIPAHEQNIGGFDLDLYYTWIPQRRLDGVKFDVLKPIRSPTHLGCCFAVSVRRFKELGEYDNQLRIWGCENMELSFKIWMCGGHIEIIPCSRVGHLFRNIAPYSYNGDGHEIIKKNCIRVAEVWMDDYKYFYYDRIYNTQRNIDIGDITDRQSLRKKLKCKSFKWYLETAYPDIYLPIGQQASGQIRNIGVPDKCLETPIHWANYGRSVYYSECDKQILIQHFILTMDGKIRRDEGCLELQDSTVIVMLCHQINNGRWIYRKNGSIRHEATGRCMEISSGRVKATKCNGDVRQKWKWRRHMLGKLSTL